MVGYLLMLTNVFSYVLDALNYQGIAIVAWVGDRARARRLPAAASTQTYDAAWSSGPAGSRPSTPAASSPGSSATGDRRDPQDRGHDREPVLRHLGAAADLRDRVRPCTPAALARRQAVVVRDGRPERSDRRGRRRMGGPRALPPLRQVLRRARDRSRSERRPPGDLRRCATGPAFYAAARREAHEARTPMGSAAMSLRINSDIGEAYGAVEPRPTTRRSWPTSTLANVACGFHAGDPMVMRRDGARWPSGSASRSAPTRATRTCRVSGAARWRWTRTS